MSSITPDGARSEIAENALVEGNPVKDSSKNKVTNVEQLTSDSSGNLQATAHLPVVQPTATAKMFDLTGTAASGVLTRTFVAGGEVTTFTAAGYARITVTDEGNQITDGDYYIQFGTIV